MQNKVNPIIIGIAVVAALILCFFIYKHSIDDGSAKQLAPTTDSFKPGYSGGGGGSSRPAPGSGAPGTSSTPGSAPAAPGAPQAPTGSGTGQ